MSFDYVPYEGFRFLSEEEIKMFDLDSISENSWVGYILEVDLEHCKKLHYIHKDYPFCPEKVEVKYKMLSKYCKGIVDRSNIKVGGVRKLILNLNNKVKDILHYRNLKY